jgi:hypothetical protein
MCAALSLVAARASTIAPHATNIIAPRIAM